MTITPLRANRRQRLTAATKIMKSYEETLNATRVVLRDAEAFGLTPDEAAQLDLLLATGHHIVRGWRRRVEDGA